MSVEALAAAWARTENAPAGSVVIAETEVAARLRGGVPWKLAGPQALSMAVVVRPDIAPMQEALLWAAASLAVAEAITTTTGVENGAIWPDSVTRSAEEPPSCSVNVLAQLGPGAIDHVVVSVRADLEALAIESTEPSRAALVSAISAALGRTVGQLEDDPVALIESFTDVCLIMDQSVQVKLLPRGEARGRVTAVDRDGFLVLESSTGMLERIAPASLRSLQLADSPSTELR